MDEGTASETIPDLKDIEVKIGRKTPEGLLRWMREEASSLRGDGKLSAAYDAGKETGKKSLDEKIKKLKVEMVSVCVRARMCARARGGTSCWTCGRLFSRMSFAEVTTVLRDHTDALLRFRFAAPVV